jgi:methyl acetate hydrolase
MQLVERGKLTLDERAAKHLPELGKLQVLNGFDAASRPVFEPAAKDVTLLNLMTHTSGFCEAVWDQQMFECHGRSDTANVDPRTRWHYGTEPHWSGRLVEVAAS